MSIYNHRTNLSTGRYCGFLVVTVATATSIHIAWLYLALAIDRKYIPIISLFTD